MFIIMELIISFEVFSIKTTCKIGFKKECNVCDCKMGGWFFSSNFCSTYELNIKIVMKSVTGNFKVWFALGLPSCGHYILFIYLHSSHSHPSKQSVKSFLSELAVFCSHQNRSNYCRNWNAGDRGPVDELYQDIEKHCAFSYSTLL